jgi:anti-sigma regulatory factor (Ser/Thr protein kinase)
MPEYARRTLCRCLASTDSAAASAREIVNTVLAADIDEALLADLTLVTSELVTNAVRYGRADDWIWLHIALTDDEVAITVSGRSRENVEADSLEGCRDLFAETGRGLTIVRRLSDAFTVYSAGLTMMRAAHAR